MSRTSVPLEIMSEDRETCPQCGQPSLLAHGNVLMILRKDCKPWGPTYGSPNIARTYIGARVECNSSSCRWQGRLTADGIEEYDWHDNEPEEESMGERVPWSGPPRWHARGPYVCWGPKVDRECRNHFVATVMVIHERLKEMLR